MPEQYWCTIFSHVQVRSGYSGSHLVECAGKKRIGLSNGNTHLVRKSSGIGKLAPLLEVQLIVTQALLKYQKLRTSQKCVRFSLYEGLEFLLLRRLHIFIVSLIMLDTNQITKTGRIECGSL